MEIQANQGRLTSLIEESVHFQGLTKAPPALTHSQVKLCSGEVGKNWEEQM